MDMESASKTVSMAKGSRLYGSLSWGLLIIVYFIKYLIELYIKSPDLNLIRKDVWVLAIIFASICMLLTVILSVAGFIIGVAALIRSLRDGKDQMTRNAAIFGLVLNISNMGANWFLSFSYKFPEL